MFREIELPKVPVEVILSDYLIRGSLQPRGELIGYLNDQNWSFVPMRDTEFFPLAMERRVKGLKQKLTVANKAFIKVVILLQEADAQRVSVPASKRPVIVYTEYFAIQGDLHVSADAPDEDLLDEMHDFYALSAVSVYPLKPAASVPTAGAPMALVSRPLLQAYQVK